MDIKLNFQTKNFMIFIFLLKGLIKILCELSTASRKSAVRLRQRLLKWLTICVMSDDITFEQIKKQLNRFVEVIKVIDLTDVPLHMKEILFVKVTDLGMEQMNHVFQIAQVFSADVVDIGADSVLLETKAKESKNNELIALIKSRFKRINVVRGGAVAIEAISTRSR